METGKLVVFDPNKMAVVKVRDKSGVWWKLEGKCLRCGKCCGRKCTDLTSEILDGKKMAKCNAQWTKRWGCMLYPIDPHQELRDGCGYSWTKENKNDT